MMKLVDPLIREKELLMDRYVELLKKTNLSEREIEMKKEMQKQLVKLEFQIEEKNNGESSNII